MSLETGTKRPLFYKRQYIVSKAFQWRFIGYMAGAALTFVLCVYAATLYFFHEVAVKALADGLAPNHLFFRMLDNYRTVLTETFVIPSLILVVGMTVYSVVWSNKIAGPLYRLSRHLREQRTGPVPDLLKFRQGDFFQDIPEAFNEFVKTLEKGNKGSEGK